MKNGDVVARGDGDDDLVGEGVFTGVFFHASDCECSGRIVDYTSGRSGTRGGVLRLLGEEYRHAYWNHGIDRNIKNKKVHALF